FLCMERSYKIVASRGGGVGYVSGTLLVRLPEPAPGAQSRTMAAACRGHHVLPSALQSYSEKRTRCELWPLVQSCLARVEVPEDTVLRLSSQLDAVARGGRSGRRVKISRPDPQYAALVEKMCTGLAWSILGRKDVTLQLDKVWGVIQKEGDYCPVQQHSCDGAPNGFVSILELGFLQKGRAAAVGLGTRRW
ncbi:unnamed protein product, partial [Prorocentrum cordatum]